jgi:hypothetical protein
VCRTVALDWVYFWKRNLLFRLLHRLFQRTASESQLYASSSWVKALWVMGHCTMNVSPAPILFNSRERVTHPSLSFSFGLPPPPSNSCASLSFCSNASARRFRKSLRLTSPTVWLARTSSTVFAWEMKRGLGVGSVIVEDE